MINNKKFNSVGILGFAGYLPFWRMKTAEIGQNWGQDKVEALGTSQKAVADLDEDCLTMAVEASQDALKRSGIHAQKIGAVFIGSESHPYAVKPTGTILADILGIKNEYFCADLEFACKAATTGLQIVAAMIESGLIEYGLVVGSDKAQSEPGDALEYTAAAGAAAFILAKKENSLVELKATYSFNSDTPDFWRRQGCDYPCHAGRFTGEPGYFYHLKNCLSQFFKRIKKQPGDFDAVIFHMPNTKFPLKLGKSLGFKTKQLRPGFLVPQIGNPYSASSLLGLVATLEQARLNQNILLVSYGSGAGSDAFWLKTKKGIKAVQEKGRPIEKYLQENKQISYFSYLRNYGFLP